MTDEELLESVATDPLVNKRKDEIRNLVNKLKVRALRTIHRKVRGYWTKTNSSFTLSTSETTVNIEEESGLDDIYQPKFFWTTEGIIEIKPEKWFRENYPNPQDTGTPTIAVWLYGNTYYFYPIADASKTIYLSYYYSPDYTSIDNFPERFHDVVEYYILSYFEGATPGKYTLMYQQAVEEMVADAKPAEEWEPELIYGNTQEDVRDSQEELERI